jgi:hypothetical protein
VKERAFGTETEYAIAPSGGSDSGDRDRLCRWLLTRAYATLPSVRDTSSNGVFLVNGSRLYVDAGHHVEIGTSEVWNPWDAVRYILAGERILRSLADGEDAPPGWRRPLVLKTNVDYECHTSWGTHESILASRSTSRSRLADNLIPHLVSRILFAGAGGWNAFSAGLEFVVSPRAMFLERRTSVSSTQERGIWHERDEALADSRYRRIHLLCGESLNSNRAMWLRAATTVLIVGLVDGGVEAGGGAALADPVAALATIARDPSCQARVPLEGGGSATALQLQRHYLAHAEAHVGSDLLPGWAAEACRQWRAMLDRIERGSDAVASTVDWAIKYRVFRDQATRRYGFEWSEVEEWTRALDAESPTAGTGFPSLTMSPGEAFRDNTPEALEQQALWQSAVTAAGLPAGRLRAFIEMRSELLETDTRFGIVGEDGLFSRLDRAGVLDHAFPGVDNIEHAVANPPAAGRARVRGEAIRSRLDRRDDLQCDWTHLTDCRSMKRLVLADPFVETENEWTPALRRGVADRLEYPIPQVLRTYSRRCEALDRYIRGDYPGAEHLLRGLIDVRFELRSTYAHLARVLVMRDRLDEARAAVAEGRAAEVEGLEYTTARLLWFEVLFAALDGRDLAGPLGQLKAALASSSSRESWAMAPVLDHVGPRLDGQVRDLLAALVAVLSGDSDVRSLNPIGLWRSIEPAAT